MSNMEKYKNFKKGFKMAQMEDEIIEKEKRKREQVKKVPQKVPEKTTHIKLLKMMNHFNEYSVNTLVNQK